MKEQDKNINQYKLKVLSDCKIQVEYKIPIFIDKNAQTIIGTVKLKTKYRIDKDERRHSGELPTYYLIPYKDRFMQILSQKWGIKRKNILLYRKSEVININGHQVSGIYVGIFFDDESWIRDWKLKNILEDAK